MTNSAQIEPLLVPVNEAGRAIGVSPATAWRMVSAGTLESVKVGSRTLVKVDSIRKVAAQGSPTTLPTDAQPAA